MKMVETIGLDRKFLVMHNIIMLNDNCAFLCECVSVLGPIVYVQCHHAVMSIFDIILFSFFFVVLCHSSNVASVFSCARPKFQTSKSINHMFFMISGAQSRFTSMNRITLWRMCSISISKWYIIIIKYYISHAIHNIWSANASTHFPKRKMRMNNVYIICPKNWMSIHVLLLFMDL